MIDEEGEDAPIARLYGTLHDEQRRRYRNLLDKTMRRFAHNELRLFSTPGRVELGGNHTDHNGGKVLAASVHLDSIAMVEPTDDSQVVLYSEGYGEPFRVDLSRLERVQSEEGKTDALIRGIAAHLRKIGFKVGGFRGSIESNVLPGSGLSSSASIEILIATILSQLYNGGRVDTTTLSIVCQYAENQYFGKPCGLMDQIACAAGGIVSIDFRIADKPAIDQVDTSFSEFGYTLAVCNTGGSHADLTPDYAAVPQEMRSVAEAFGKKLCREITPEQLLAEVPRLRSIVGDRAILRCLHFFADNDRVDRQIVALRERDFNSYLDAVRKAGDSSWELLQNNYSPTNLREQGVPLALALSRRFLGDDGAVRIQGGGFAGTMQAYVPKERFDGYRRYMEDLFGSGSVTQIGVRSAGTTEIR